MIGEFLKGVTCPLHTLADRDERLAWYDRQLRTRSSPSPKRNWPSSTAGASF